METICVDLYFNILVVNMPSTRKKSPSEAKKKSLMSTKGKTSVKKNTKKTKVTELNDDSYLQSQGAVGHPSTQGSVSTVSNTSGNSIQKETSISTNQAILSMLQKLMLRIRHWNVRTPSVPPLLHHPHVRTLGFPTSPAHTRGKSPYLSLRQVQVSVRLSHSPIVMLCITSQ